MELRKLQRVVIDALEDIKAQDIRVFDTTPLTSLFDRVVIVSATSNRQTRALASNVRDKVKAAGGDVIAVEGEETGEWVLVDLGDIVVHIMQPAIRTYYHLEEIWGGKPVRVKLGAAGAAGTAAGLDDEDEAAEATSDDAAAPRRAPAATAAPKAAPRRTSATRSTTASAPGRTTTRATVRRRAAPADGGDEH